MKKDFENAKTEVQGVHYSRYIASWLIRGGDYFGEQFKKWLEANGCTKEEICDITIMATTGKMELQHGGYGFVGADRYIQKMNEMIDKINNAEEPEEEP